MRLKNYLANKTLLQCHRLFWECPTQICNLPVTPCSQYNSKEDEEEGYIRTPHDDGHGVHAKDGPGWKDWRGHRCGATRFTAVLTGAGPWAIIQILRTVKRSVAHGSHVRDGNIWGHQTFQHWNQCQEHKASYAFMDAKQIWSNN